MDITKIYLVENCYGVPNKIYIGKTKNLHRRKRDHFLNYGPQMVFTVIDKIQSLNKKDWKPLECYWIEQFRQWGFDVQNKNKGGGGPDYRTESFKTNLRIKTQDKPKPKGFGDKISKIKLSQNLIMTQETKDKISKAKINHPCFQTKSFKEKHSKSIVQLNKDGDIIQRFKSIDEAADSNLNFKRSNISCCLIGFSKSAYGYKWEYDTFTSFS